MGRGLSESRGSGLVREYMGLGKRTDVLSLVREYARGSRRTGILSVS